MGSVKKAIKIYARLKPSESSCKYEVDKHINDDGSTDDILALNAGINSAGDEYTSGSSSLNRPDSYKFRFSKVFDYTSTQEALFDEMCQPVLESALEGYNSTIFAYGQTGSGKTYTMTGSRQQWKNRGIIPRALSYIFDKFEELTNQGFIASAFLSYLEIYNESGYDLLHPGFSSGRIEDLKKVQLLEDAQQQIHMKNLTVHPIKSEDEAMQLLYLGDHNRIVAETPMNEASTRSHCIFTIHLNIRQANSSTVRRSKVHLVDLAGSERLANSNSTGQLFHEARHINLALHYLEQVIVALGEAHRSHIPYRNSMMTSILRDSLGGNCMTSMVATLSLEHRNLSETLSTCRFSQRVALVQNAATLNEETDPMLLIAQLKLENKRLKDIISNSSIRAMDSNMEPLSQEEVAECWKLVERFMSDGDEEAILPVAPDMRMVQTCFRCLKMAVQMNKDEIVGTASVQGKLSHHHLLHPPGIIERSSGRYTEAMTREQLVECLRVRDAEIDVLSKMLRPGSQNKSKGRFCQQNFIVQGSNYEFGDGPQQTMQQHMKIFKPHVDAHDDSYEGGGGFQRIAPVDQPQPPQRPLQIDSLNFIPSNERRQQTTTGNSGGISVDELFDSDSLFVEGLSDSKKRALDIFIGSYKGKEKLEKIRNGLISKRNEVESIENQLRRNHANLKNLKVVLMSSDGGGEDEDIFMREAVDAQSQSIHKQEKQLVRSKEETARLEETLKGLCGHLMSDFEGYWISRNRHNRQGFMGRGIPSEVDFALGASAASTAAAIKQNAISSSSSGIGTMGENGNNKQLTEMTKGFVRGVGGQNYYYPKKSARSKSSNVIPPCTPTEFQYKATSPPSPPRTSARASKSLSASRARDKLSARGKYPSLNSPRKSTGPSPRRQYHQSTSGLQVPPGTPTVHHLHRNPQQSTFGHEQSSNNFASHYQPQSGNRNQQQSYEALTTLYGNSNGNRRGNDSEDDDLLKELPMTGDETIDQEILSFFRTRQAVFKQINNDKTGKVPNTAGGGVLANFQQYS